jgi:hypothetical protein
MSCEERTLTREGAELEREKVRKEIRYWADGRETSKLAEIIPKENLHSYTQIYRYMRYHIQEVLKSPWPGNPYGIWHDSGPNAYTNYHRTTPARPDSLRARLRGLINDAVESGVLEKEEGQMAIRAFRRSPEIDKKERDIMKPFLRRAVVEGPFSKSAKDRPYDFLIYMIFYDMQHYAGPEVRNYELAFGFLQEQGISPAGTVETYFSDKLRKRYERLDAEEVAGMFEFYGSMHDYRVYFGDITLPGLEHLVNVYHRWPAVNGQVISRCAFYDGKELKYKDAAGIEITTPILVIHDSQTEGIRRGAVVRTFDHVLYKVVKVERISYPDPLPATWTILYLSKN